MEAPVADKHRVCHCLDVPLTAHFAELALEGGDLVYDARLALLLGFVVVYY